MSYKPFNIFGRRKKDITPISRIFMHSTIITSNISTSTSHSFGTGQTKSVFL